MEQEQPVKITTVVFDTPIRPFDIVKFRGAVIQHIGDSTQVYYHNHTGEDTLRYSYPLIQYKRLFGKAAIVGIDEGAKDLQRFIDFEPTTFQIGEHEVQISVKQILPQSYKLKIAEGRYLYSLERWLPLNSENYTLFRQTNSLIEHVAILERILTGNILSFAKGIHLEVDSEIEVSIHTLGDPYPVKNKKNAFIAFDLEFESNILLPNHIGLGKNASIGCGVVNRLK